MTAIRNILMALLFVCTLGKGIAQPDLKYKQELFGLTILRDAMIDNIYYYAPTGLELAIDSEGKPYFKFLLMRYTGTNARGDQGDHRFKSLLTMKIINQTPPLSVIADVKKALLNKMDQQHLVLKPIPIKNLQALLVYSSLEDSNPADTSLYVFENGFFETIPGEAGKGTYWKERNFVLRLDDHTAQAFWQGFNKKQTILSVGYAFFSNVKSIHQPVPEFSGSPGLVAEMKRHYFLKPDSLQDDDKLRSVIIRSGAFQITIDTKKWPDLLQKVDINEQVPPGYAILEVYCYDFNNEIRNDLYLKRLEIEATGVNGKPVQQTYTFKSSQPDIYAATLFFPNAVRLDKPYKYRIVEIDHYGKVTKSVWRIRESWHEILDITQKPEETTENVNEISFK